jgi:RNA recognition motif-containing protein
MLEDRDGRSKGCAVVEFKHRDGANKCIDNMHRTELHDRLIIAKEIRVSFDLISYHFKALYVSNLSVFE